MKGLLLLSGGIDSPVAGFLMGKEECVIDALHFSYQPFTDRKPEEKSGRIARMWGWEFFVCEAGEGLGDIAKRCTHRYYFVLTKRLMLRIAEAFAEARRCEFLITGENMGQVSSQTLENLRVIDDAVRMPVLRPLIGYDKLEIVNLAITIGTYETSKGPEVCDVLGPKHPATSARLDAILSEEAGLDIEEIQENAARKIRKANL